MNIATFRIRAAACCWLAALGVAAAEPQENNVGIERLKADVYYLSSQTLEGRGLATPGLTLAAEHIHAEFKRLGLRSAPPDGGYYQPFTAVGLTVNNVVGVIEGRGDIANETLIIGAHYDHLGYGNVGLSPRAPQNKMHPGADDNASGVSTLLELARRFATCELTPRRRLVFIAFCGEENGEIGSHYYASKAPLFPMKDTVSMINFDMVGRMRNNELGIAGNQSAKEFDQLLSTANTNPHLNLLLGGGEIPEHSDNYQFWKLGIPILFFCTGTHDDRHTPSDTADKVNYEGMEKVVNLAEKVVEQLLCVPRPTFVAAPK